MINIYILLSFLAFSNHKKVEDKVIEHGKIRIEVKANVGARLNQLYFDNIPLLVSDKEQEEYYGSTWWPSPQRDWHWPPPKSIDEGAYHYKQSATSAKMTSSPLKTSDLRLTKGIEIINDHKVRFTYEAENISKENKTFGHWEITRLAKGGRVIFPAGSAFGDAEFPTFPGFLYFKKDKNTEKLINPSVDCFDIPIKKGCGTIPHTDKTKLLADGQGGWAAYLNDGILLVKSFENTEIDRLAPTQGEVELFVNPDLDFIELEEHGAYQTVAPEQTSTWTVDWYMYKYPSNMPHDAASIKEFIEKNIKVNNL